MRRDLNRIAGWVLTAVLLAVLGGCAASGLPAVSGPERGMIVGHIDVPGGLRAVYLHQIGKVYIGAFNLPRAHIQRNGNFMFVDLPPGRYYLAGFDDGRAPYWIPHDETSIRRATIELAPGGVAYLGSYRVANVDAPRFGRGSFDLERALHPREAEILRSLRPLAEGTGWAERIDARLGRR